MMHAEDLKAWDLLACSNLLAHLPYFEKIKIGL
jgi:hypothetical protein